jgi:hypothetical protein
VLVKIIIVFLLAMVLVGMIGKVLFPGAAKRMLRRAPVCKSCGRHVIGKTCACRKGRS